MIKELASRHLEVFFVVAEELHFGRAATRLHVAQPAVSATIAALEEGLGVQLFDRTRRKVRLTAAGEAFLVEARAASTQIERAVRVARRTDAGELGRLTIGFTSVCPLTSLPGHIARFMRAHPSVDVHLRQLGTRQQMEALKLGHLDLGFTVFPEADEDIAAKTFLEEPLAAFVHAEHQLAKKKRIPLKSLLGEPFILMTLEREPKLREAYLALCKKYFLPPRVVLELDQIESMLGFVAAKLGVSLAPAAARTLEFPGVVSRLVSPGLMGGVTALWSREHLGPAARLFLDESGLAVSQ